MPTPLERRQLRQEAELAAGRLQFPLPSSVIHLRVSFLGDGVPSQPTKKGFSPSPKKKDAPIRGWLKNRAPTLANRKVD